MAKRILVVEDYKDTRDFMKLLLEVSGYEVLEATDGYEAVESVKEQTPDLILMDISLPSMDGLTATEIIRNYDGVSEIPIVAVTAHGNTFYNRAIAAGCNDLVAKPVDFDALKPKIEKLLGA